MRDDRPATMADVAALARVSTSTVSRALRGSPLVNAETTARVMSAATELSFAVSRAASSLATGRLGRIAVMVSGPIGSWFNGSLIDALYGQLHAADQELLIYRLLDVPQRDNFFVTLPARRNADALVVASFALTTAERTRLDEAGLPVVFVNQRVPGGVSVSIDDEAGARIGARHLLNLGHRDLAFVGLRNRHGFHYSATARETGFAAEVSAVPGASLTQLSAGSASDGEAVVAELLSSRRLPTAVMAESDELAASLLSALRLTGFQVPGEISVLGFDSDPTSAVMGLSTIAQPVAELGRQAGIRALQLASGVRPEEPELILPTSVVLRRSTARPTTPVSDAQPAEAAARR